MFNSNCLNELAKEVSFLKRESKFKPSDFISLCGFYNHESGTKSLAQLCGILASNRGVSLSTEGLNVDLTIQELIC